MEHGTSAGKLPKRGLAGGRAAQEKDGGHSALTEFPPPSCEGVDVTYTVLVYEDKEDGGYWANVAELPGCYTSGETLEEIEEKRERRDCRLSRVH